MTAPIKPALKRADGKDAWGWAPLIADPTAPTLVELNAAGGFNLACSLFSDQEQPTVTDNKVTLPRLLCETDEVEVSGTTKHSLPDLQVSFQPQAASGADGKKAWATMVDKMDGFLWRRQDVASSTDLAVGVFVDIFPVTLGTKVPGKTSTGPEGVYSFTQSASLRSSPSYNKAVVAGS